MPCRGRGVHCNRKSVRALSKVWRGDSLAAEAFTHALSGCPVVERHTGVGLGAVNLAEKLVETASVVDDLLLHVRAGRVGPVVDVSSNVALGLLGDLAKPLLDDTIEEWLNRQRVRKDGQEQESRQTCLKILNLERDGAHAGLASGKADDALRVGHPHDRVGRAGFLQGGESSGGAKVHAD